MLVIKNIYKEFNLTGNLEDKKIALNNVSLKIKKGEFVTVIGGNGSGKSTLMNIICGVHKPDKGKIILDGDDITNLKEHQRAKYFGRVFQDPKQGTAADMSILENLEIATRRNKKITFRWGFIKNHQLLFKEQLKELNLGLENRLNQKVGVLSGGQRQALTLLMATINKPKLLLLDEHTAALDPKTSKIVLDLTQKIINDNNLTTIMITHNMRDAIKYGNRLVMLHNGEILLDVSNQEKQQLKVEDLLNKFDQANESITIPLI
ncbi:MAG: ATP-binding cassette domain-containing protein [Bacilli bacterium]|nr:ATP-binding cassette domain-containing protein [Bacilli bacterium]